MTIFSSSVLVAAAVTLLAGCQHQPSRTLPSGAAASASASPAAGVGTLEERLMRLEVAYAKNAEALEFLRRVYEQQKAQAAEAERDEPADDAMFAVDIADGVKAGQVDGPAGASVTIIKAFDFACPYCQRMAGTLDELVKEYDGKVRVVYMNLVVHPPAKPAHLASCAAAKQGKYRQFKDAFWNQGFLPYAQSHDESKLGEANILAIAKGVGLDTKKLKADMASSECAARLEADRAELEKFHVSATPTFFINGKLVAGALPKEAMKQLVDEQLRLVEASGVPGGEYYAKVVLAKGEKQFRSKADPKPR